VGFPGVGKTTIFRALTGLESTSGAPVRRPDKPALGVIKVPDRRLDALAEIYRPRKVTPAEICFLDFPAPPNTSRLSLDAGIVTQMRDLEAFALVIRGFADVAGEPPNPALELRAFLDELLLADLGVVEKRLERLRKEKGSEQEKGLLERCREALEEGRSLRQIGLRPDEDRLLSAFAFVSLKPALVVLNVADTDIKAPLPAELLEAAEVAGIPAMAVCGQVEMEVGELSPDEQRAYLSELGVTEPARDRFIQASYALLSLVSFLTVGPDEVRAWPVRSGTPASKAAGKIHSDIERGFIRAEVIRVEDLLKHRTEAKCREVGVQRVEGRDYLVQDGDVIHFRFAV
jgi:GTP-binding protein YchF